MENVSLWKKFDLEGNWIAFRGMISGVNEVIIG